MKTSLLSVAAILAVCYAATTFEKRAECTAGVRNVQGRTCTISCGTDRPGGDYDRSRTGSFEACIQACAADSKCVTAQYHEDNKFCYFKNVKNKAVSVVLDDTVDCDPIPAADGAACKKDSDCSSNYCNPGSGTSYCGIGPNGAGCTQSSQCLYGYCDTTKKVCAYQTFPDGSSCSYDYYCSSGFCNSLGKCGKTADRGDCKVDNDCSSGVCNTYYKICGRDYSGCFRPSECSSNVCTAEYRCGPIAGGGRCYRDADCTSKYCNLGDGTYGQSYCGLGKTGDYQSGRCTQDNQCQSGYCDKTNKLCAVPPKL